MAQTRTYSDLLALIRARMGVSSLLDSELTIAKNLINDRIDQAYRESNLWENVLAIGEERVVDTSGTAPIVPYTGAVVDAGAASPYAGDIDSAFRAHSLSPWNINSPAEWQFQGASGGLRLTNYGTVWGTAHTPTTITAASGTIRVSIASSLVDAYVGGTVSIAEVDDATVDINGEHTITEVSSSAYTAGDTTIRFVISDTTSHTFSLTGDEEMKLPSAWVTYKKRLTLNYGDGSGETTAIPREWFRFVAHAVAADFLRQDEKFQAAAIEEQRAHAQLSLELARCDAQHASEAIFNRVRTHGSEARSEAIFS